MSSSSGYSLQNFLTFKKLCLFEASGSIYDILHLRMIVKYEQIIVHLEYKTLINRITSVKSSFNPNIIWKMPIDESKYTIEIFSPEPLTKL